MRIRAVAFSYAVVAALAGVCADVQAQSPGSVKVFASNGFRAVIEDLAPRCEKAVGAKLTMQFGTSTSMLQRVGSGEAFDVAVATTEAIDELVKTGKVDAATRTALGRSGIGIGVRHGASKPDIKTEDAIKRTFVNAKSVSYAGDGASRPHIEAMFDALGIRSAMAPKTLLEQGSVRAAEKVASGQAELLITLVSEILPAPGVDLVGSLPARFQHPVSFATAVGKSASNATAGKSLIACLSGPDVASVLKAKGMER
jgi:molybdate transport system substrate-binding protein